MSMPHPEAPAPEVEITSGRVRGVWRDGSAAFRGIPFAQPPVGPLRFAAPVAPDPWTGTRDATEPGPTPPRGVSDQPTLIPEPSVPGEATLNVDVYTPRPGDRGAGLPVLVYIHGGGYTAGSPASPWYDGGAFARDGIVTVTVSYRLGFDGFGHIPDAVSNRAVRDWLAALEWVRDNITGFGGDPARVTIAGQSAGGGAVLTLLGMPAAQHLFARAWAMSPALADVPAARASAVSERLAELAGVAPTRDGFASVDEERLTALQDAAARPVGGGPLAAATGVLVDGLPWGPMVDGDLIARPTVESLRAGVGSDKPLVIGTTDDEFTMVTDSARGKLRWVPATVGLALLGLRGARGRAYLAANRSQRRRGTAAMLGRYVTDVVFRAPLVRAAEARRSAPASTWVYRFSWVPPARGWALHCLDVPFWFDCLADPAVPALAGDRPPQGLADQLHGAADAFIERGDPGWMPWSRRPGLTRIFGAPASARDVDPDGYASARALA